MSRFCHALQALLLLFLCLALLCGCSHNPSEHALSLVLTLTANEPNCPAGEVYLIPHAASLYALPEQEKDTPTIRIAPKDVLSAAFGRSATSDIWELSEALIDDGALRFSTTASPCEFIVLRCINRSDTDELAALLLQRLELLRQQYRATEYEALVARARVTVIGKYVVLAVCTDPESATRVLLHALS